MGICVLFLIPLKTGDNLQIEGIRIKEHLTISLRDYETTFHFPAFLLQICIRYEEIWAK
jgi:hypothetical protein